MTTQPPTDKDLIIHALKFTANWNETGNGTTSTEDRRALKLPKLKNEICDKDKLYVARLRRIAESINKPALPLNYQPVYLAKLYQ